MLHILLIAMMAVVLARDGVSGLPMVSDLTPWAVVVCTLAAFGCLIAAQHATLLVCSRWLNATGSWRAVWTADAALVAFRWLALACHTVAIVVFGWLDALRVLLGGNWIAADELLAAAPPLILVVMGWLSYYGVDRALREASLMGALDSGAPIPSLPTRTQYASDQARSQVLLVVVPVGLIAMWVEAADRMLPRLPAPWNDTRLWQGEAASAAAHILGVALALIFMPLIIRLLWDTVPLGPGDLRQRLWAMCQEHRVRCRDLLVWRTHGRMLNGAVIGMVPRLRYILLTDTLLETLDPAQVESVMAHELAHARRHHLPWLMATMLATIGLSWTASVWSLSHLAGSLGPAADDAMLVVLGASLTTCLITILTFGWVSRRFEEQADAFAARHLSGDRPNQGAVPVDITAQAAGVMASALAAVARHNHIAPNALSFRHGSIASRQRNLMRLVGRPATRLRIDRVVSAIKAFAALGILLTIALGVVAG